MAKLRELFIFSSYFLCFPSYREHKCHFKTRKTKALKDSARIHPEGISQIRWGDGLNSGDPPSLSQVRRSHRLGGVMVLNPGTHHGFLKGDLAGSALTLH